MPSLVARELSGPGRGLVAGAYDGGKLRAIVEVFTCAGEAAGAYPVGAPLPAGAMPLFGCVMTSAALGSATLALGTAQAPTRYRAAAALAAEVPAFFVSAASAATPLAAPEQLVLSVAGAALPASGRIVVVMVYVDNS